MSLSGTRTILLAATAGLALAACHSLDSPSFPTSGSDARVYNLQTGRFEWPDGDGQSSRADQRRSSLAGDRREAPTRISGDERSYNPQTGRWENARD